MTDLADFVQQLLETDKIILDLLHEAEKEDEAVKLALIQQVQEILFLTVKYGSK